MTDKLNFAKAADHYLQKLQSSFSHSIVSQIEELAIALQLSWKQDKQIFLCGNGGSAANAIHIANDFHYGVGVCGSEPNLQGMRVEALPANQGILTCLANDIGYENVYSQQLLVKGNEGDLLIVLSGSGNSPNVINALKTARKKGMKSFAIVAFGGGTCKRLADNAIHFPVEDMQIAEDTQLIIGHLCMQWLNTHKHEQLHSQKNG